MRLTDATAGPDLTLGERPGKGVISNNESTIANTPQQISQSAQEGLSQGRFSEVIKSVWGFDPDEVIRAQSLLRREPDADESTYGADAQQAARIPPDVDSQILELRRMFQL